MNELKPEPPPWSGAGLALEQERHGLPADGIPGPKTAQRIVLRLFYNDLKTDPWPAPGWGK